MKKILVAIVLISCVLSGCVGKNAHKELVNEAFNEGRSHGYNAGYDAGYCDGYSYAQEGMAIHIKYGFDDIAYDIKHEYGIHPEDAINILWLYAVGETIERNELDNAIWAIRSYYWDTYDIVVDLEEYRP